MILETGQTQSPDAASLALGDTVGVAFLWVSVVSVLGVNAGLHL